MPSPETLSKYLTFDLACNKNPLMRMPAAFGMKIQLGSHFSEEKLPFFTKQNFPWLLLCLKNILFLEVPCANKTGIIHGSIILSI